MANILCSGCGGFGSNAESGAALAKAQTRAALARTKLIESEVIPKKKVATVQTVQPVQQATVPIVQQQQPATAQPTPLQIALQSSSFKCDHSCPVISSQPVLVVLQDQVLCTVVAVVPQSVAQTVPSHASISALPVLLIAGIVFWLVFR